MKKTLAMTLMILLFLGAAMPVPGEASPPLSSGVVNQTANIYWGKGTQFPILAAVSAGIKLDVYEYDANWVLVLYKTYATYQGKTVNHSFFGYLMRDAITCDPPLEGESSPKADTGPGKKKGKRPKPRTGEQQPEASPAPSEAPEGTNEPDVTAEPQDEFDWIIRTNGLQSQKVIVDGTTITCSFSLMAQKAGGTSPSSDSAFNRGMRTPYAATAFYAMKFSTADYLAEQGLAWLTGEGGFDVTLKTAGATFYLDTGAEDFAMVSFTLPAQGEGALDPSITGETGNGTVKADAGSTSLSGKSSVSIQIKKSGSGYQFVLLGLKPGGGNLEFPAVLEKTFADPDRFDKEAAKEDARREKAEAERDRMQEEMKKKAEEAAKATVEPLAPLTPVEDLPLAPLTPLGDEPLAPLAPLTPVDDDVLAPLAPLTPVDGDVLAPLAPLVPVTDDSAPPFPGSSFRLKRGDFQCA